MMLNQLAKECHEANQHWWHDPKTGERLNRNKGELLMLIVSEISVDPSVKVKEYPFEGYSALMERPFIGM